MSDIIKLLPDSVANQIAAGEVVQRPASVVKELMENAIDAGASGISVIIKDAGRTLVQVIDNGKGMSVTDARMAFERHATSKISSAEDLFAIHSMGFRGEALASIAAVAEVTLKTRQYTAETGTEITVSASVVVGQEPVGCPVGTNIAVKNVFYNIPARRKFLKSDSHEFRLIVQEFIRVALAFPDIEYTLLNNNTEVYKLQKGNCRQRIVQLFGKAISPTLIDINSDTSIARISGFIGKPDSAKKYHGDQFFFVNNRFMKHPYFHKAIVTAMQKIIPADTVPAYFIFFNMPPDRIDINIHPTKTEIKFEDEQAVWQLLNASVRQAIGKFNVIPSIDFNTENAIEIPVLSANTEFHAPEIQVDPHFNPFESDEQRRDNTIKPGSIRNFRKDANLGNWEDLYRGFESPAEEDEKHSMGIDPELFQDATKNNTLQPQLIQVKGKYILSPVKSGLMIIDQRRAHERILYGKYLQSLSGGQIASQQSMYPAIMELSGDDYNLLLEVLDELHHTGFDIGDLGNRTVSISGMPSWLINEDPREVLGKIIEELKTRPVDLKQKALEDIAALLAASSAIGFSRSMNIDEMRELIDNLFQCDNPNYSLNGKPMVVILPLNEIENKFK